MARNVEFSEEQVIEKAMDVFWRNGYSATSMRDLTNAMEINSSSLYNTIGDKHTLFIKCLEKYTVHRQQRFGDLLPKGLSPLEQLKYLIREVAKSVDTTPTACMAIKAAFEMAERDTQIHSILKRDTDFSYAIIKELLEKAFAAGELDVEIDVIATAQFIVNSFTGWYEMYILNKDKKQVQAMSEFLIKRML